MLGARCRVDGPLSRTCRPCFNHCNLRTSSSPTPSPAYPPLLEVSTNKFKAHQERPQQTRPRVQLRAARIHHAVAAELIIRRSGCPGAGPV